MVSNNLEPIFTTWMALPEITTTFFSSRSLMHFLPSKTNTEIMRPEASKRLIKYDELLDENLVLESKYYKTLPNVQAGDFGFVHDDNNVITDNVYYDDRTSKNIFTLQKSQESRIDRMIEQVSTDNLSICTAKNVDSSSPAKSEIKTSEIKQQQSRNRFKLQDDQYSQKYDSLQSAEFRNYMQKDLFSSTRMEQWIQQRSRTSRCILQTPAITSKPLPSLFETLQQSNTVMKTQECTKDAAELFTFANIEIPRNIPSEWYSMKRPYPRREYHTWKISRIENDAMKCVDQRFFASDIRTTPQKQNTSYGSRFDHLAYSGNLGNQGSRKSSSCLPYISRRVFSSRSCTIIQQSIAGEIESLKKDLSANASIVRLKNRRSHPGRVSLARLRSFSRDASRSKKSEDCEKNDKSQRSKRKVETKDYDACSQEVAKSRCRIENKKICGKTRQKDTCVSSQDDACEKQRERKSESCKNYTCPELKGQKPCTWDKERCPEDRKCDAKGRVSSRNRARQSKDPNCSQERTTDTRCSERRQSKSYKRREDCEKPNEPRAICEDSIKGKNDCESKYEKRCEKRNVSEKKRRKCTRNNRKRSNSCRRRKSSRVSDKSCNKVDGKRRYSQQSIFSVPRDRKSFSTLISNIVLDTDLSKTTQRFYASCNKDEKDRKQGPSCEKRKRKCKTEEKDETKKKCVKGPAKCMSRKKTNDKMQICQSCTPKDKDKKSCESTKKTCHEEYCTSRKEEFMKDEKLKKESKKPHPSPTIKDKKLEESIKEQIDREYKEIDECKGIKTKEKKSNKAKMVSTEHKPSGLDCIISSCKEQEKKDSEKFTSTPNESIIPTDAVFKWFNIQSKIINGKIPIIVKDIKLFNVMFDQSFSTAKLDYQDDFAIERTTDNNKIVRNCSANSDDFIHGDELPIYIETEYENEEDDVNDRAISRPVSGID